MKKAFVFGASGQMGQYLVPFLKEKGYEVFCPSRYLVNFEDLSMTHLRFLFESHQPDEIYNLAGVNFAPDSWNLPALYMQVNGVVPMRLLSLTKEVLPKARFFQAGSAEVFAKMTLYQEENTEKLPENPYGLSKLMAMEAVRIYREKFGLFACTGIFFNAESPKRNRFFFAERVAEKVVELRRQWNTTVEKLPQDRIKFGRLDAIRDWGWAPEYVEVAWRMLQGGIPDDVVIGTGETHTCKDFLIEALVVAGFTDAAENFDWYVDYDKTIESKDFNCMCAVPSKAKALYDWQAQYKFKDVVKMLVEAEMEAEGVLGKSVTTR